MKKIHYFNSYEEDIVLSKKQNFKLKENYKWIHKNYFYQVVSFLLYIFIVIFSFFYSKFSHVRIQNKKVLKGQKGYYLYCNHTQMIGDVLNPFQISFPHHPYIICSPANLGIPVLGKLLPMAGALPIPDKLHDLSKLKEAIYDRIQKNHPIVVYPEAHVWPWYTKIRPFPKSSFHFPLECKAPVFTATTTYQKRKWFKRPKITIYIDGPFLEDKNLSKKENIHALHDTVYETMVKRSQYSNYEYIKYEKKDSL